MLIFSKNITEHKQHLDEFIKIIKENGLVVLPKKIKIFQTKKLIFKISNIPRNYYANTKIFRICR